MRLGLLFAIASAALLSAAPAANAAWSMSFSNVGVTPLTVGESGSVDIKLTNVSTASETFTPNPIGIQPSCGEDVDPCGVPDPGVFSLTSVTGIDGQCNGDSFSTAQDNVFDAGASTITPVTPRALMVNDFCTLRFAFDVLKLPTTDVDPVTPGIQTQQRYFARPTEHPGNLFSVKGDLTVNPCSAHCPVVTPPPVATPTVPAPPATKKKCKKKHRRAAAARKCKRKKK